MVFYAILKFYSFIKWLFRSQKRQWYIIASAVFTITTVVYFLELFKYPDLVTTNELVESRLSEILIAEKGTGCEMPVLDPFSEEAMSFDKETPKIECGETDWVTCYKSECYVVPEILRQKLHIECIYKDIIFVSDDHYYIGEPTKVLGQDKYVLNKSDHVKVHCTGVDVHRSGLLFHSSYTFWSGNMAGFRIQKTPTEYSGNNFNILIIMFDSTSRNGFIRRMPKSYKYLTDDLQAVVLKKYNIVGDGTPGALFPILTGQMELELEDSRKSFANKKYIDIKPFLFNLLKEHGYQTAYFEDMPLIGTFQSRFNGFKSQPTDHYLRPFFMEEYNKPWWDARKKYCVGAVAQHKFILNLTAQFMEIEGKKFCFSLIVETSHDDFNMITLADEDLTLYLKSIKDKGVFNNTMLLVMGDHGARFESIRNTYQGKIEERLPFVSVVLPDKLKHIRPDMLRNLKSNAEVLTTHYDMHTSLLDVLSLRKYRNRYKIPGSDIERGLSFLKPIPKTRSCAEAGVMPHWCACTKWNNVSTTDMIYQRAAEALARFIDSICDEKRTVCARRKLLAIDWVLQRGPNEGMLGYKNKREIDRYIGKYEEKMRVRAHKEYYQAKIVMSPGRSVFEGSMHYIVKDDFFVISERDISRINAYGDEPKCVSSTHPHLNKYCFCKNKLRWNHTDYNNIE